MRNYNLVVRAQRVRVLLTRLEVPKMDVARAIARAEKAAIRAEANLASIACHSMACKAFLPVLLEGFGRVDENLVVQ